MGDLAISLMPIICFDLDIIALLSDNDSSPTSTSSNLNNVSSSSSSPSPAIAPDSSARG